MAKSSSHHPGCGCCCSINRVRFLVLILATFAISTLFANLILFNFTSILHTELDPQDKPVAGLDSLHEYSIWHDRRKREVDTSQPAGKAVSSVLKEGRAATEEDDDDDAEEGFPILPSTKAPATTTTTEQMTLRPRRKTEKPAVRYITNSPTTPTTFTSTTTIKTTTTPEPEPEPETTARTSAPVKKSSGVSDVVLSEVEKTLAKLREAEEKEEAALKNREEKEGDVGKSIDERVIVPKPAAKRVSDESSIIRGLLYAAPGLGVLIGIMPAQQLQRKVGIRKLFSVALAVSGLLTLSMPYVVGFAGSFALLAARFLQGLFFSVVFPLIGCITVTWGSLREQLKFISTMFTFVALGPIGSWPLTMLLHSNEVPLYVLYAIHGFALILFAIVWQIFYRDRPQYHPWVNGLELNRIVAGKVQELQNNRLSSQSCCSVLVRSLSAWSIWISACALFVSVALFAIFMPSILCSHDVFFVDYLGVYAALPFMLVPLSFALSGAANSCRCVTSTALVRIWNTVAFVLAALLTLAVPFIMSLAGENTPLLLLPLTMAPLGLVVVGFLRSLTLVGRFYAQQIVAYCGVSFGVAFTILPITAAMIVHENKISEWLRIFFIVAAILLVAAVEFAVFGRGRSASWAETSWDPLAKTKMNTLALIDYNQDECGLYELRHIPTNQKEHR